MTQDQSFIVAEVSANHLGDFDRALCIIDAAASAGANAVKFQTWKHDTMVLDKAFRLQSGPWVGRLLHDLYREAETPWEWHERLFQHARDQGLIPFSSVFDMPSLEFLEQLGCPMYRISSFEIEDLDLITAAAATRKPLIISTGMATPTMILAARTRAMAAGCTDLTLLKCTSAYPSPMASMNLGAMEFLRHPKIPGQNVKVGVSDHTLGIAVPVAATALGAAVIEKHLTLSRGDGGPDAGFSLNPKEFAEMVKACREAKEACGSNALEPNYSERSSFLLRRSLYWAQDMKPGQLVTRESMASARPWGALPPSKAYAFVARRMKEPVSRGTPVRMDQVE